MEGARGGRVIRADEREEESLPESSGGVRLAIDHRVGAQNLVQRIFRFGPGRTPELHNQASEDVMYVAEGIGTAELGGAAVELAPGTALFAPPGVGYWLENAGPHDLVIVSVLSPPPGAPAGARSEVRFDLGPPSPNRSSGITHQWVREEDQEPISAGPDRVFRVLVDARHGSRTVTQFVGFIETGGAPPHRHTYEEAIYILDGEGLVQIDGEDTPIARGTSVFLPPGVPHRLLNVGPETLRLLGVFSPPGSPAAKQDLLV